MLIAHSEIVWSLSQSAAELSPQFWRLTGDYAYVLRYMLLWMAASTWVHCVALAATVRRARDVFRSPGIQREIRIRAVSLTQVALS